MRLHITLRLVIFVIYVSSVINGGLPPPTPHPTSALYTDSTTNPPPTTPTPAPTPVPNVALSPAPKPAPTRVCSGPKQIQIQELVETRSSGRYPTASIRRAIFKSRRRNRHDLHFARGHGHGFCETYRHRTADVKPVDTSSVSPRPIPFWLDTCPKYTKYFYFPKTIIYKEQTCWMLSPWYRLRCPYTACTSRSCRGVKDAYTGITACRQSTWRSYHYYIWCSRSGLVRRRIRLPQCCSCMRLRCP